MGSVIHIVKICIAWGFAVGAVALVVFDRQQVGVPMALAVISIAFSELPE